MYEPSKGELLMFENQPAKSFANQMLQRTIYERQDKKLPNN
jgi:hypothetical protein